MHCVDTGVTPPGQAAGGKKEKIEKQNRKRRFFSAYVEVQPMVVLQSVVKLLASSMCSWARCMKSCRDIVAEHSHKQAPAVVDNSIVELNNEINCQN